MGVIALLRAVWECVNAELGTETISRASIINFLEEMRGLGVLGGESIVFDGQL